MKTLLYYQTIAIILLALCGCVSTNSNNIEIFDSVRYDTLLDVRGAVKSVYTT